MSGVAAFEVDTKEKPSGFFTSQPCTGTEGFDRDFGELRFEFGERTEIGRDAGGEFARRFALQFGERDSK